MKIRKRLTQDQIQKLIEIRGHKFVLNSHNRYYITNEELKSISNSDDDFDTTTQTNQYDNTDMPEMSARHPKEGYMMNIEQYCEFYDLPYENIRSYKLVSHTGTPYYNIAFHEQLTENFENFGSKIINEIREISTRPKTIKRKETEDGDQYLLVVDPADIHIGKLCDSFEVGEDYNNQIAVKRVKEGVLGILKKAKGFKIKQILFVAGNDILHIDTPKRTTTSGTQQDTDGMWYSNFLIAKQLYIDIITDLLEVADVHFMYNPSNHDYQSGFFLADVIKTYFEKTENITFDTSIAHRKYYTYGQNLIGSSHGDGAKIQDLPALMAHESDQWSKCRHRYIYTHHVHHKISKDYIGVTVESLRSPSGTDSWHSRNGYTGVPKAIEGFLHHPEFGQIARITHIF